MSIRRRLPEDPRWLELVRKYESDLVSFSIDVVGLTPSHQQEEMYRAIQVPGEKVSISSGHGAGKTKGVAVIVFWHTVCFEGSTMLLTANDMDQLKVTAWKEIGIVHNLIKNGAFGWLYDYIEVLASSMLRVRGFEQTWFVESKTANDKNANKVAGRHGRYFMIIADEASTLSDNVLTTLRGACTEKENRMLLLSQFTRNAGFFYRTFNDMSKRNGGAWVNLRFNSFDSPFTDTKQLIEEWESFDDDERRVRMLGLPPINSDSVMMSMRHSEKMYKLGQIINDDEPYGYFVLSDIAAGEGMRDKSAIVIAKVVGFGDYGENARRVEIINIPLHTNTIKSNILANYIAEAGEELSNAVYLPDAGGLGINVCQDLELLNIPVVRVNWGSPCTQLKNKERYMNKRAQAMHQAARAAKTGRLSIRTNEYKKVILDQSSRIPKTYSGSRSKMTVPPKGSKEWSGLKSPDLWDAISFAFLENAIYIAAEKTGENNKTDEIDALFEEFD